MSGTEKAVFIFQVVIPDDRNDGGSIKIVILRIAYLVSITFVSYLIETILNKSLIPEVKATTFYVVLVVELWIKQPICAFQIPQQ